VCDFRLNWTQQTTVFNYSLLTPGLADIKAYRCVSAEESKTLNPAILESSLSAPPSGVVVYEVVDPRGH